MLMWVGGGNAAHPFRAVRALVLGRHARPLDQLQHPLWLAYKTNNSMQSQAHADTGMQLGSTAGSIPAHMWPQGVYLWQLI